MATQITPPQSTHVPQTIRGNVPPSTQEDIGSVLDRFHKWAGNPTEPVRELSYEEAVQRARRRRCEDEEPAPPGSQEAAASPAPTPPPPIPFPFIQEPPETKPSASPSGPAAEKTAKTAIKYWSAEQPEDKKPDSAAAKAALAEPAKRAAARKRSAAAAKPLPAQKHSAARAVARDAETEAFLALHKVSVQPFAGDSGQHAAPAAASVYAEVQRAAGQPEPGPMPEATFAQVLAEQIQSSVADSKVFTPSPAQESILAALPVALPQEAIAASAIAPLPDDAPAVHLTVRLTSNERETMRERARDLGVTPSAYVRRCALEVDSLRSELEHARVQHATLAQAQAAAELARAQAEARSAKAEAELSLSKHLDARDKESEWFIRLRNFVFPRKTKDQALAVRA